MSVRAGAAPEVQMRSTKTEKKTVTVLDATEYAITRVKVAYQEKAEAETRGGAKEERHASPLAGKTFVATAKDDQITVTDEKGASVTAAVRDEVADDQGGLGRPHPLHQLFPDRPLRLGEKLEPPPAVLSSILQVGGEGGPQVESGTFTLRTVEAGVATFDAALTLRVRGTGDEPTMTMELAGKLAVDTATGWPTVMTLEGPVTLGEGGGPVGRISGRGTMKMSSKLAYR